VLDAANVFGDLVAREVIGVGLAAVERQRLLFQLRPEGGQRVLELICEPPTIEHHIEVQAPSTFLSQRDLLTDLGIGIGEPDLPSKRLLEVGFGVGL
jgi:hypothetical protein